MLWAMLYENLSFVFATRLGLIKPAQLPSLAIILIDLHASEVIFDPPSYIDKTKTMLLLINLS